MTPASSGYSRPTLSPQTPEKAMIRNQCKVCPEEGIVRINEHWWCADHVRVSFDFTVPPPQPIEVHTDA